MPKQSHRSNYIEIPVFVSDRVKTERDLDLVFKKRILLKKVVVFQPCNRDARKIVLNILPCFLSTKVERMINATDPSI